MSTLVEIETAMRGLSTQELMLLEGMAQRLQRERGAGIIYDDDYGVWTEDDQTSQISEAWSLFENEEAAHG